MSIVIKPLPTVKELREVRRLTQSQLAHQAAVSQTTIANWEQNRSIPRLDELRRVCGVLGVSIDRVALTPYEALLHTHHFWYHLKAQRRFDDWVGQVLGLDTSEAKHFDPENPYSQGLLPAPMDEAFPEATSAVVPVTWKWEAVADTPEAALDQIARRITAALNRVYTL